MINELHSIRGAGNSGRNEEVPSHRMKKVCCILTYPVSTVLLALLFTGCEESDAGLKQRIAESDAQRVTAENRVKDLEKQLEEARKQPGTAPVAISVNPAPTAPAAGDEARLAALGSAAGAVQRSMESSILPDKLLVYRHAAWAGFYADRADGNGQGVAVPFFSEDGVRWKCGWSPAQIKAMLQSTTPYQAAAPPVPTTPPPPVKTPEPPVVNNTTPTSPTVPSRPQKPTTPAGNVEIIRGEDGMDLEVTTGPDGKKRVRPVVR